MTPAYRTWMLALLALAACAGPDETAPLICAATVSGASVLQDFTPPCDVGPGQVLVTASGESLALSGYAFPPRTPDDVAFVDGWELHFSRVLVTFDHVTLSENPDRSPTDQSQSGPMVARVDGPWAVDLHAGGPLAGKSGGDERAVPIAVLRAQNLAGDAPFDDERRYAFGFESVPATHAARNVNLDTAALADYEDMIAHGYVFLAVGQATFRGVDCVASDTAYDFSRLPTMVELRLGLHIPAEYANCQNADNDPAQPFPQEIHQRGLHIGGRDATVAQVTFHTDHTYWESTEHDAPLHFDQLAARLVGSRSAVTERAEDLVGVGFMPFRDAGGQLVPWRTCLASYQPPASGAMSFDTRSIPVDPRASAEHALRDYADFIAYTTSTFGHLNGEDGLCYVRRRYASPP
jgi:hypothetical protein